MALRDLIETFPWCRYSKKLKERIGRLRNGGIFTKLQAEERRMRLAKGEAGSIKEGNCVHFYFLVDPEDGMIVDAKFQAFGQSALLGAADVSCDLIVGKNYDQAKRISAELIDKQIRDKSQVPAFPFEASMHLNLVLDAIDDACEMCLNIPLPESYTAPPVPLDFGEAREGGYPGWDEMEESKKLSVIEEVIKEDIGPYIALDGGGVKAVRMNGENEVMIQYAGSCTSCYSAIGSTLSSIQQILQAKVHPELVVTPDLEGTTLSGL